MADTPRLKVKYQTEIVPALVEQLGIKNINCVPKLEKIVVNMGVGAAAGDSKLLDAAMNDMRIITGQQPCVTRAKKSIAGFHVREGQAIGCKVTLRGDRTPTRPESPDFAHASDLAQFVWQTQPEFDIHAACYPEGHPEAATLAQDVANLRFKQEAGATHLLTQLFFDNMHFYRFLNLARRAGITLPVSAGVMPIVKRSQIERTVALSSASLPSEFTRMISRYQDDPESLYAAGVDYAVQQLRDLIEGGADGVHLYAMNDAKVAAAVYEGIKDLL